MYIPKLYRQSGIYCIRNIITGKIYIGSSNNISNRIRTHYSELINNKHDNSNLQRSFNKYTINSFIWGVIEFCDINDTIVREQYYLDNCNDWRQLYNNRRIAESNKGIRRKPSTIDTRKKSSESHKKYIQSIGGKPLNFKEYQSKAWEKNKTEIYEFDISGNLINHYSSIQEACDKTNVSRETIAAGSLRKGFCRLTQTYFRRTNEL